MDSRERHARIEDLFARAAQLPDAERAAFLHGVCDAALAREVLELIALDATAGEWLEPAQPPADAGGGRYEVREEIGHGGMGVVHRVWDRQLERELAMKVLRHARKRDGPDSSRARHLRRFLDEARITAQLDHPGILPVHELLVDARGQARFTMKLVRGEDLRAIYEKTRERRDGWTLTRALGVLQRVCEAMAYAHAKGVIHRDLKPSNVMVGGFGEVYVMDWGLARELERDAPSDPEPADIAAPSPSATVDGEVLGTPAYMPPEQAAGDRGAMGPQSDVYAVGAMLYELLAGHPPYLEDGAAQSSRKVWDRVRAGAPAPIGERAPRAPAELTAVCAKAMERDPGGRYPDMGEMARDLAAFVEGRVVRAYRSGALVELRKWITRNRAAAVAIGVAIAGLGAGLLIAVGQARRAEAHAREAEALSAAWRLEELRRRAERMWPPHPESIPALQGWIIDAEAAVATIGARRGSAPPNRVDPESAGHVTDLGDELARARAEANARIEELNLALASNPGVHDEYRRWIDEEIQRIEADRTRLEATWAEHESLVLQALERPAPRADMDDLRRSVAAFLDADTGVWRGLVPGHGPGIARRLELARRVAREQQAAARTWEEIGAAVLADPRYEGLRLAPQRGLVPLGPDAASGLQEFWHCTSGERPARDAQGHVVVAAETGLVLVLLPPGRFLLGAQTVDPQAPNYRDPALFGEDPAVQAYVHMESPVHPASVSAFFLSKFEVTQAQWLRLSGDDPSFYTGAAWSAVVSGRTHPVDRVSWYGAVRTLERFALTLPTEAQWEYACVAGVPRLFHFGDSTDGIERFANIRDVEFRRWVERPVVAHEVSDGFAVHAPVGSKQPNGFGLHDMHGNMAEWCLDRFCEYENPFGRLRPGDALREGAVNEGRVYRGGGCDSPPIDARSTARGVRDPDDAINGVRPARALDP